MILSVSRRTDIPAHFAPWFMNRIREGYAVSRNPMNAKQTRRVPIEPASTEAIVFWSKDPRPMLAHLKELDERGFMYLFQFTLTPYDRSIERGLREKGDIMDTMKALSDAISPERVIWRYDPILLSDGIDLDFHRHAFERMAGALSGRVRQVTISFVDMYARLKNAPFWPPEGEERLALARFIAECARSNGITARACCESADLASVGACPAACIDGALISKLIGREASFKPDKNQRTGCGCAAAVDLGAYNCCSNGCAYCYANHSAQSIARALKAHDPASPTLLGRAE